jgi:hypothetical protein
MNTCRAHPSPAHKSQRRFPGTARRRRRLRRALPGLRHGLRSHDGRGGRRLLLNDGCRGRPAGAGTWARGGLLLLLAPRVLLGQVPREPLELLGVGLAGEVAAPEQHRLDALLQQHGLRLPHRLLLRLAAARRPRPAAGAPSPRALHARAEMVGA